MRPDPRERPITPRSAARPRREGLPQPADEATFDQLKIHDPSAQPTNVAIRSRTTQAAVVWVRGTDLLAQVGARMAHRSIALQTITSRWVRQHVHRSLVVTKHSTTRGAGVARTRISRLAPVSAFGARRSSHPSPPTMTQ